MNGTAAIPLDTAPGASVWRRRLDVLFQIVALAVLVVALGCTTGLVGHGYAKMLA